MSRSNPASKLFESLERRELFTTTFAVPAAGVLNFYGDAQNDTLYIFDNGAGAINGMRFDHGLGALVAFGPIPGIQSINIYMSSGNDRVSYTVTGDMAGAAPNRFVGVDLGFGDDLLDFNAANDFDIVAGRQFNLRANGNAGHDTMRAAYSGELDGFLGLSLTGWFGDDRLITNARFAAGSAGTFFGRSWGNDNTDTIDMLVRKDVPLDPVAVDAFAAGGAGLFDTVNRTALASTDASTETDNLVP